MNKIELNTFIDSHDLSKTMISELDKLTAYRDLFKTIANSDPKLEYSGEELISYFKQIESGEWKC